MTQQQHKHTTKTQNAQHMQHILKTYTTIQKKNVHINTTQYAQLGKTYTHIQNQHTNNTPTHPGNTQKYTMIQHIHKHTQTYTTHTHNIHKTYATIHHNTQQDANIFKQHTKNTNTLLTYTKLLKTYTKYTRNTNIHKA